MSGEKNQPNLSLKDPSVFKNRLKSKRRIIQSFEAKANEKRNFAEKIADTITAGLGSITFLTINVIWFLTWVLINTGRIPNIPVFDPFPFGLLTMTVSLEAIFLAVVVLISQNRAAKVDDLRDEIELQIDTIAEEEITKIIKLQILLLKKNGIDVSQDLELQEMLEPANTQNLESTLEKQLH